MRGKPPGSIVWLYWDSTNIADEGDVIRTQTGKCYRVTKNRIQEKGKHTGRQHLLCLVLEEDWEAEEDDVVWPIYWYSRG